MTAGVYDDNGTMLAMWQQAAAALAEQSKKIDAMGVDAQAVQTLVKETESRSSGTTTRTAQLIRSMVTSSLESHYISPLGLCLQSLALEDLMAVKCVCREWHRVSSDYTIQISVWSNHLQLHNPALYNQHNKIGDKRFLVIAGKNFYQSNYCKEKLKQ